MTGIQKNKHQIFFIWLALLVIAVLLRAAILGEYPLTDQTEARYAEIGRIMLATNDWITPRLETDVPFWGKPPLSFWLTGASFKAFGINEYAARIPSLLLSLATGWVIFLLARTRSQKTGGIIATSIFFTTGVVFISSGMVMTDLSLLFSTTLSLASFWLAIKNKSRLWGYLFFIGLALGLLSKGPLALVLVIIPLIIWLSLLKKWRLFWRNLPWLGGTVTLIALTIPWYLAAELKTPGFLYYFLVGEHFFRFIESGWQGDLYGVGHAHPRGTIWVYFLLAGLPWSPLAIKVAYRWLTSPTISPEQEWRVFLLAWAAVPLFFFSFTSNILPTYILPSIPAIALMISTEYQPDSNKYTYSLHWPGWIIPITVITLILLFQDKLTDRSQKQAISDLSIIQPNSNGLVYLYSKPFSAGFYSQGKATLISTNEEVSDFLNQQEHPLFMIKRSKLPEFGEDKLARLELVKEYPRWLMYQKKR